MPRDMEQYEHYQAQMCALSCLYTKLSLIYYRAPQALNGRELPSAEEVKTALDEAVVLLRPWWAAQEPPVQVQEEHSQ